MHLFTTHVRSDHDAVVSPSTRGYTCQQLVGGRQVLAAQYWMESDLVSQQRVDKKGTHSWRERKINRSHDGDEVNGRLQMVLTQPIDNISK